MSNTKWKPSLSAVATTLRIVATQLEEKDWPEDEWTVIDEHHDLNLSRENHKLNITIYYADNGDTDTSIWYRLPSISEDILGG